MHITITLAWWMIPTLITMASILYALVIHDDGGGYFGGLGNLLMLIPALFISMVSWMVAAFFLK